MIFSIRATIRALAAPNHRISCPRRLWTYLTRELWRRGDGTHESGAFLLGSARGERLAVSALAFYDDLDPHAYDSGVCVLDGNAFAELWKICRARRLTVVGDAHTHPGVAKQSGADRTNPMVARIGHVAIIIPNYARAPVDLTSLGIYEYCGDHQWKTLMSSGGGSLYVGFWS